jgi:hypothetical protein
MSLIQTEVVRRQIPPWERAESGKVSRKEVCRDGEERLCWRRIRSMPMYLSASHHFRKIVIVSAAEGASKLEDAEGSRIATLCHQSSCPSASARREAHRGARGCMDACAQCKTYRVSSRTEMFAWRLGSRPSQHQVGTF